MLYRIGIRMIERATKMTKYLDDMTFLVWKNIIISINIKNTHQKDGIFWWGLFILEIIF